MRELSFGSLFLACRRHLILFAICVCCGLGATLAVVLQLHPRYNASATVVLKTRVEHLSDIKSVVPDLVTSQPDLAVVRTEVAILQNAQLAREVVGQLHLDELPEFRLHVGLLSRLITVVAPRLGQAAPFDPAAAGMAAAVDNYQQRLGVFNDGRSYVFNVSFEASSPELAASIVNTHVQAYLAHQYQDKQEILRNASAWVGREVDMLRYEVETSENTVHQFRAQSGLLTSRGATAVQEQVANLSSQLAQARADLAARLAQMSDLRGGTGTQSRAIDDTLVEKLREHDADAHAVLQSLLEKEGPNHPLVVQARAQVAELDARVAQAIGRVAQATGSDARIASDRVAVLTATLAKLQGQLSGEDAAQSQLNQLERDLDATRGVYQTLRARQAEIEAQRGSEFPDSQLVAAAMPPNRSNFPNVPLLLALGLVGSTASGAALAWWREQPGKGLEEPLQLEAETGLTVMQSIPRTRGKAPQLAVKVISEPRSQFADSIRALRGSVARSMGEKSDRVLAITSAAVGEGKTTLAVALARSMTTSGLRVLLIDCDLRRPKVAATLGIASAGAGLIAVLQNRCPLDQAVRSDPRSPLEVLCPEQLVEVPQDLLGPRFSELLKQARTTYDTIVVDTAPVGFISDAVLVAQRVDQVLMVVRWRGTTLPLLSVAMRALDRCEAKVCGCVLNALDEKVVARSNPYIAELQRIKHDYFTNV